MNWPPLLTPGEVGCTLNFALFVCVCVCVCVEGWGWDVEFWILLILGFGEKVAIFFGIGHL